MDDPIIQRARARLEAAEQFDEGTYDRLVALRDQGLIADVNSLGLLKATYLGLIDPSGKELRAALGAVQFESPKLGVSVNVNMGDSFAARLDAAIQRSNGKKVEGSTAGVIEHDANEIKQPMLPIPGKMRRV
jgi:hypothetical protein